VVSLSEKNKDHHAAFGDTVPCPVLTKTCLVGEEFGFVFSAVKIKNAEVSVKQFVVFQFFAVYCKIEQCSTKYCASCARGLYQLPCFWLMFLPVTESYAKSVA
jgi:hypothetical protein